MYKRITSNLSPYGEAKVWISDGGWKTTHPHKSADAYSFFNSSEYKIAIACGEFTNKVMLVVSDILTGYIIYKKYLSTTSTKVDSKNSADKKYTYSKSVLEKMQKDLYHNFPKQLDKDILNNEILKRPDGRYEFLAKGSINGTNGVYHITTKDDLIIHRVFIPEERWDTFSTTYGLPDINDIPKLK